MGCRGPPGFVETQQFTNGLRFCSNRGLRAGRFCQKEGIFPHRIALGNQSGIKGVSRQSTCTAEVRSPRQRGPSTSTSRSSGVNPLSPDRVLMIISPHVDTYDPLRFSNLGGSLYLRARLARRHATDTTADELLSMYRSGNAACQWYRPRCGGYLCRSLVNDGAPRRALGFLPRTRFPARAAL